jgi:hypothetical protein
LCNSLNMIIILEEPPYHTVFNPHSTFQRF